MRSLARLAFVWLAALLTPCKDGCCPFCGWEDDDEPTRSCPCGCGLTVPRDLEGPDIFVTDGELDG